MPLRIPALLLVVLLAGTAAAGGAQSVKASMLRQNLEATLQSIAEGLDGVMGYTILDLATGDRIERLEDEVFPTASTIKLAILYELFRQADAGKLRLDEARLLDRRHAVGGSGILQHLTAPAMPLRDYATLMIVLSDNSATNLLIDVVGMENVTSAMASLGLTQTKLRRRMMDAEAAERGDENVSTPSEIARLLAAIERGDGLAAKSREQLVEILQKPKDSALRRGVPGDVAVANKPGELDGVRVDAGIVYVEGRPYVFSAMTSYVRDEQEAEEAIEAASRAAFDYFDRLARSSEYGRGIR